MVSRITGQRKFDLIIVNSSQSRCPNSRQLEEVDTVGKGSFSDRRGCDQMLSEVLQQTCGTTRVICKRDFIHVLLGKMYVKYYRWFLWWSVQHCCRLKAGDFCLQHRCDAIRAILFGERRSLRGMLYQLKGEIRLSYHDKMLGGSWIHCIWCG